MYMVVRKNEPVCCTNEQRNIAVRHLPYPREEWETAINCLLLRKLYMKTRDGRVGFLQAVNLLFRARLYRRMRRIVGEILV